MVSQCNKVFSPVYFIEKMNDTSVSKEGGQTQGQLTQRLAVSIVYKLVTPEP